METTINGIKITAMSTGSTDHLHYKCRDLLNTARGARDALTEAAKMLRSLDAKGHARMCELHAEALSRFL